MKTYDFKLNVNVTLDGTKFQFRDSNGELIATYDIAYNIVNFGEKYNNPNADYAERSSVNALAELLLDTYYLRKN